MPNSVEWIQRYTGNLEATNLLRGRTPAEDRLKNWQVRLKRTTGIADNKTDLG